MTLLWNSSSQTMISGSGEGVSTTFQEIHRVRTVFIIIMKCSIPFSHKCTEKEEFMNMVSDATLALNL